MDIILRLPIWVVFTIAASGAFALGIWLIMLLEKPNGR